MIYIFPPPATDICGEIEGGIRESMAEYTQIHVEETNITAATPSMEWWPTTILVLCEIYIILAQNIYQIFN